MSVQAPSPPLSPPLARPGLTSSLRPGRRPWLLVGGLLAVVVCAGVFALVYVGADARVPVLSTTRPLAAGQSVTAEDLRVVRIVPDPQLAPLAASDTSQVVGRSVALPVPAGTLLTESHLGPVGWPPVGQAVAGLPVKPGRLPAGLAAGSPVLVVSVAPDPILQDPGGAGIGPVPATVMHVAEDADGAGTAVVTLLLAHTDAVTVAGAAHDLALVHTGAQQ
jgi:hypothetical protein